MIFISFIVFLFILGLLTFIHELGHFFASKRLAVQVKEFSLGFGKRLFSKRINNTEYAINLVPLGGYVKLAGDSVVDYTGQPNEYLSKPLRQRLIIILCGPILNYLLGFLFFWAIFFIGYPASTTKIGALLEGFGAEEAGLKAGDRIIEIDGKRVNCWEELQRVIYSKVDAKRVRVTYIRDNQEYTTYVEIRKKQVSDLLGQQRKVGILGISPSEEEMVLRYGFLKSSLLALLKTAQLTSMTYRALWLIISGRLSVRESVSGPLGMLFITHKVTPLGTIAILNLIAVLSISISIINLLPLPILDGGHIVLLLIERLRGRGLTLKEERIITRIGFTIIGSLLILATYNDLLRLFGR
ncbi:MAG: site-2 protease family protein [Candidatus Omnitrophica bacterium]|nr:site-2 protease family protein [Candidatus Omnitrophota bacterium]